LITSSSTSKPSQQTSKQPKTWTRKNEKTSSNPLDSKVIAVGILTSQEKYYIYDKDNEERLLKAFWKTWSKLNGSQPGVDVVGFNHKQFDLPFITRSYKHGQKVEPYNKADSWMCVRS
jgi:uncharacterized protein YprB with RNaseH-like and TPR domain